MRPLASLRSSVSDTQRQFKPDIRSVRESGAVREAKRQTEETNPTTELQTNK